MGNKIFEFLSIATSGGHKLSPQAIQIYKILMGISKKGRCLVSDVEMAHEAGVSLKVFLKHQKYLISPIDQMDGKPLVQMPLSKEGYDKRRVVRLAIF